MLDHAPARALLQRGAKFIDGDLDGAHRAFPELLADEGPGEVQIARLYAQREVLHAQVDVHHRAPLGIGLGDRLAERLKRGGLRHPQHHRRVLHDVPRGAVALIDDQRQVGVDDGGALFLRHGLVGAFAARGEQRRDAGLVEDAQLLVGGRRAVELKGVGAGAGQDVEFDQRERVRRGAPRDELLGRAADHKAGVVERDVVYAKAHALGVEHAPRGGLEQAEDHVERRLSDLPRVQTPRDRRRLGHAVDHRTGAQLGEHLAVERRYEAHGRALRRVVHARCGGDHGAVHRQREALQVRLGPQQQLRAIYEQRRAAAVARFHHRRRRIGAGQRDVDGVRPGRDQPGHVDLGGSGSGRHGGDHLAVEADGRGAEHPREPQRLTAGPRARGYVDGGVKIDVFEARVRVDRDGAAKVDRKSGDRGRRAGLHRHARAALPGARDHAGEADEPEGAQHPSEAKRGKGRHRVCLSRTRGRGGIENQGAQVDSGIGVQYPPRRRFRG